MLLFRVGDFYETFGEDAIKASKILGIVLTKRNNGGANEELAGFPHHSLDTYLPKLVRAGQRVAICDQLEDPSQAKGIVRRGVTELVTPGVSFNDHVLNTNQNNFLASVHWTDQQQIGISFLDISTGEFWVAEGSIAYVDKLLQSFAPSEVLFPKKRKEAFLHWFGDQWTTFSLEDWAYTLDFGYDILTKHFQTSSLKGFGIEDLPLGIVAAGVIIQYLADTEHKQIHHIRSITRLDQEKYVWLDRFTIRNLELVAPQQDGGVPLIDILDQTLTPMGGRMMRRWVVLPLKDVQAIQDRQDMVRNWVENPDALEHVRQILKPMGDLERLISKIAAGRINPREMVQLKKSLIQIPLLRAHLAPYAFPMAVAFRDQLSDCAGLVERLEKELREDAPMLSNQGQMIASGVDENLDELHRMAFSGKDYLLEIQQREATRTGIPSLKIAYNKVFGYYLEVSNAHKDKVPQEWIRKQTLVNAERYITEELKVYEEKILSAESKIFEIEYRLFQALVAVAQEYIGPIQQNARIIGTLDCLASFAKVSRKNRYVAPTMSDSKVLSISQGRHPVIEQQLPLGEEYIPNDLYLDDVNQQIIILTGPNMAGKSALLRQTALIVLMAQIGCYVPASQADLGVVDKIFTRVGASDNLSKGESTFMVEMTETASILNNLSDRSLIIMDEIGRGTSTYDGVSIAWSIAEYLHNHPKYQPWTLFATHYHELNELAQEFPRIKNFNVAVREYQGKIVFLRKLIPGGSEHSFGIHVAQLAGMPSRVVSRAETLLQHLEKESRLEDQKEKIREVPKSNLQLTLFDAPDPKLEKIRLQLEALDINSLTPMEALLRLNEWKSMLR